MEKKYLLMIIAMAVVTYLPRVLPLVLLTRRDIPEVVIRWLKFIPAAILAALLAPGILIQEGSLVLSLENNFLLAAVPAFLLAVYKKNIFLTVVVGVLAVVILEYL